MKKTIYSLLTLALAVFAFTSCEDVPSPFDFPSGGGTTPSASVEPAGSGTLADPYNVAAAVDYTQTLEVGTESPSSIYIKGVISSIREEYTTQYGNGTFYISDDGSANNQFLVYRALYLGNKRFASDDTQIQVGDSVVICGIVTNYNGTLETQQNKAYIYKLNGKEAGGGGGTPAGDAKGSGTLEDPWNPVAANAFASSLGSGEETDKDYYIKGKIAKIATNGEFSAQYGNASFYISEDGEDANTFYVFRTKYLGNKNWATGDTQIKVGDEVIICGLLTNYMGNTPETVQNKSYIYSLNGQTDGGGTPGGETGEVKEVTIAEFNAAAVSDNVWYQLTGTVKNLNDGDKYGNFDLEDATGSVYVYGVLSEKGGAKAQFQELAAEKGIKNGSKLTIIGTRGDYNGKIEVMNAYFVSVDNSGIPDDPNPGGEGDAGSYSKPYSVDEAIAANTGTGVYVKGYIVGCVSGQVYDSGATFGVLSDVKTNLLIASSVTESDPSKCMPVQLPSGAVRNGLNLADNPDNLGKEVLLYGNIEAYFKVPGVKSVTYAEIGGTSIGNKADARYYSNFH